MTLSTNTLRLLIAGGGTGGHVLPAVAVLEELRHRQVPFEALWIGSHQGVERGIAKANDVPFVAIQTGKLRRYLAWKTITDMIRIPIGTVQGMVQTHRFHPDVIYSTGGAVSVPIVVGHALGSKVRLGRRAPILTHEQTAQIGIANRVASRFAATFAVGFDETAKVARKRHKHVVVTGNPVRASLASGVAERGRTWAGFTDQLPIVYVTGGALGATPLNERIGSVIGQLLPHAQVIHQAGPPSVNQDVERLERMRGALPAELQRRYKVVEFVREELPDVFAMADLVVARAGAGTVSELGFLGKSSILIPLPGTWGDEQRKNARILSAVGAAVVLEQTDTDSSHLLNEILNLLRDEPRRAEMAIAAKSTSRPDAAGRLVDQLLALANRSSA